MACPNRKKLLIGYLFTNNYFCSTMNHKSPNTPSDLALIKGYLGALMEAPPHQTLQKTIATLSVDRALLEEAFLQWAGLPLAQFTTFLTPQYAQGCCNSATMPSNTAYPIQLVRCEMNALAGKELLYDTYETPIGTLAIGASAQGLCYAAFSTNITADVAQMQLLWPHAVLLQGRNTLHEDALQYIINPNHPPLRLLVSATDFQWTVWQQLMQIPSGCLLSYSQLAERIQLPNGARAVGTAVGSNPLAYFSPCHRVLQSSGKLGGYRWGLLQKQLLIGYEAAQKTIKSKHLASSKV